MIDANEEQKREMEELALAEPEPPEWEWYDPEHPTADAEPPEGCLGTEPPDGMEQELLEQHYKEERERQELDEQKAYGIPQDGKLAKTEAKEC